MLSRLNCINCNSDLHTEIKNDEDNCRKCENKLIGVNDTHNFRLNPIFIVIWSVMCLFLFILDFIFCNIVEVGTCTNNFNIQVPFTILSSLISSIGIYVLIFTVYLPINGFIKSKSVGQWSTVEGEIIHSEILAKWIPGYPDGEFNYLPMIVYTYKINKEEYFSDQIYYRFKNNGNNLEKVKYHS